MSRKATCILFALWVTLIVSLSLVPLKVKFRLGTTGRWHNAGHLCMFFVATVLAWRLVSGVFARFICCLGVIGVAFTMEWVEKVSYHIPYEWNDIRFDCLGVLCGVLLMFFAPAMSSNNPKGPAEESPAETTASKNR